MEVVGLLNLEPVVNPNRAVGTLTIGKRGTTVATVVVGTVTGVLRLNDKLFENWRLRLNDNPADAAVGARLNEVLLLNCRLRVNVCVPGVDANERLFVNCVLRVKFTAGTKGNWALGVRANDVLFVNCVLCVEFTDGTKGNWALAVRLNERLFVNCMLCVKFTDGTKGNWALGVRVNDVLLLNCVLRVKFTDDAFMKGGRILVKNAPLNGVLPGNRAGAKLRNGRAQAGDASNRATVRTATDR
jgi:hypothetical protein